MAINTWGGLAVGVVIGGGLGDDAPAVNTDDSSSFGGAKNVNSDSDSDNGGQGLFSLWGHEVWVYVGGILGFGDTIGPYITTGPMIGANPDWAIGGGIHLGKAFGAGMVIPLRQAFTSYNKHQDKISAYIDTGHQYVSSAYDHLNGALIRMPQAIEGLEKIITNLC